MTTINQYFDVQTPPSAREPSSQFLTRIFQAADALHERILALRTFVPAMGATIEDAHYPLTELIAQLDQRLRSADEDAITARRLERELFTVKAAAFLTKHPSELTPGDRDRLLRNSDDLATEVLALTSEHRSKTADIRRLQQDLKDAHARAIDLDDFKAAIEVVLRDEQKAGRLKRGGAQRLLRKAALCMPERIVDADVVPF